MKHVARLLDLWGMRGRGLCKMGCLMKYITLGKVHGFKWISFRYYITFHPIHLLSQLLLLSSSIFSTPLHICCCTCIHLLMIKECSAQVGGSGTKHGAGLGKFKSPAANKCTKIMVELQKQHI